jgi:predicted transcriptional regulator of viral defense system
MKIDYFFHHNPIFTRKDFVKYLLGQGFESNYAQAGAIKYYSKIGKIASVRRDCYIVLPPEENIETFPVDYYLLAAKLADDSVLAYHTALELHGIAYSVFYRFNYLSHHHNRQFSFRDGIFQAVPFPKKLLQKHQEEFGTIEINRGGINIKVTSLARTIVDVLDRIDLAGGLEEVWRSLDAVTTFDAQEAVDYALLLGNATTIAKLGFYLEQRPPVLAVEQKYIDKLCRYIPSSPHYIDRKPKSKINNHAQNQNKHRAKFIKKWNLIMPEAVINRNWEEPNLGDTNEIF